MDLDALQSALALGPLKATCNVCGKQHIIPPTGSPSAALSKRARRCLEVRICNGAKGIVCLASVSGLWRTMSALLETCLGVGYPHAPMQADCSRQDGILRCASDVVRLMHCVDSIDRCLDSVRWRVKGVHCYEYSVYPIGCLPAYLLALDGAQADAQAVTLIADFVFGLRLWRTMVDASEAIAACSLSWDGPGQCEPIIIISCVRHTIAARDEMRALIEGGDYGFCNG